LVDFKSIGRLTKYLATKYSGTLNLLFLTFRNTLSGVLIKFKSNASGFFPSSQWSHEQRNFFSCVY